MSRKIKIYDQGIVTAFGTNRISNDKSYRLKLDFNSNPNIDLDELGRILDEFQGEFSATIVTTNPEILYRCLDLLNKQGCLSISIQDATSEFINGLDADKVKGYHISSVDYVSDNESYKVNLQKFIEAFPELSLSVFSPSIQGKLLFNDSNFPDTQKLYENLKIAFSRFKNKNYEHLSLKKMQELRKWMATHPGESIPGVAFDSKNIYNIANLKAKHQYPGCLLTLDSDLQPFKDATTPVTFVINNMSDLPFDVVKRLKDEHVPCQIAFKNYIKSDAQSDNPTQKPYSLDDYLIVCEGMSKLLNGIDPNSPEGQRFKEIYLRVGYFLKYDHIAAYPKTLDEEEYSKENVVNCRNLVNAFKKSITVCSGFAEVLRNACLIMGIDCEKFDCRMDVIMDMNTIISRHYINDHTKLVFKKDDYGIIRPAHSLNKVCINGDWYNCDPTSDYSAIKKGFCPVYVLRSDKVLKKNRTI